MGLHHKERRFLCFKIWRTNRKWSRLFGLLRLEELVYDGEEDENPEKGDNEEDVRTSHLQRGMEFGERKSGRKRHLRGSAHHFYGLDSRLLTCHPSPSLLFTSTHILLP